MHSPRARPPPATCLRHHYLAPPVIISARLFHRARGEIHNPSERAWRAASCTSASPVTPAPGAKSRPAAAACGHLIPRNDNQFTARHGSHRRQPSPRPSHTAHHRPPSPQPSPRPSSPNRRASQNRRRVTAGLQGVRNRRPGPSAGTDSRPLAQALTCARPCRRRAARSVRRRRPPPRHGRRLASTR